MPKNFYLAAHRHRKRGQLLVITSANGTTLKLKLKVFPWSKGLTKTDAALRLMEFITGDRLDHDSKPWGDLRRVLKRDESAASMFFNNPPRNEPVQAYLFYSLDSTSAENWLRLVFGVYRASLPAIVRSIQQEYETWTNLPWREGDETDINPNPAQQVDQAMKTTAMIGDEIQKRSQANAAQQSAIISQTIAEQLAIASQQVGGFYDQQA